MGIWSHEPFSNDPAYDLVLELVAGDDLSCIEVALDRYLTGSGECSEIYHACEAIAAVQILTILLGKGTDAENIPEVFHPWVKEHHQVPSAELINRARLTMRQIVTLNSAILDFWNSTDGGSKWKTCMQEIIEKF